MFPLRERVLSELPLLILLTFFCCLINAQLILSGAKPSPAQWTNNFASIYSLIFNEGITIRSILRTQLYSSSDYGQAFACGFYCNGANMNCMFAVYIIQTDSQGRPTRISLPQVVWSANRNKPVKINSTLTLTSDGDLSLKDADEAVVWSTNTSGKSVVGLNLTEEGNLVLFDKNNATIWQSFDYPTDSLVPGQRLKPGQKLTASVSSVNWTQVPLLSFTMTREGVDGLMETDPPQFYYRRSFSREYNSSDTLYVQYQSGSLSLFVNSELQFYAFSFRPARSAQYVRLDSRGQLRAFEWSEGSSQWIQVADLLSNSISDCGHPLACGTYGVCSSGQCSCQTLNAGHPYFKQIDDTNPDLGCSPLTPLSCEAFGDHSFVELRDVLYFITSLEASDLNSIDRQSCQQACAKNCSCKAAIFKYKNESNGDCYLPSDIFSFMNQEQGTTVVNYTTYIKVQNIPNISQAPPIPNVKGKANSLPIILGSSLSALSALALLIGYLIWRRKYADGNAAEEDDYLDQLPEMPSRFSYEDLNTSTQNFSNKLGSGGFGSVFKGALLDGIEVAVKKLEGISHMKDSFLAEVKTIGSIHHVNLVRLVGFCAEKSHRLLVYEYMANGSLDRWIFHKNGLVLEWQQRKKIILDIAKGLHYLHEDCRHKIIHLDIKPQNILLDENFNAKVADFGLAKLIDRDQSQVMTIMKGTPGYLAPEWLSSVISEKVDVYSFGVVVLEVVCGRRVFDNSLDEEEKHLPGLLKRKAEEDQLLDMVDKYSENMQLHGLEAVDMMKVAAWCLQGDFAKRPAMSMVAKVLEGVMDLPVDLDYNFSNPTWVKVTQGICQKGGKVGVTTPVLPSVLSGPR